MEGKRLIRTLGLRNVLSFGAEAQKVELEPLNVLIGPNGSGKSNLIEVLKLLRALRGDFAYCFRQSGGIEEWLWKGANDVPTAEVDIVVDFPVGEKPLRYKMSFTMVGQRAELLGEAVEDEHVIDKNYYYRFQSGSPAEIVHTSLEEFRKDYPLLKVQGFRGFWERKENQSILSQVIDRNGYPELTYLGDMFSLFKVFDQTRNEMIQQRGKPQGADYANEFLEEGGLNLGLILNDLEHRGIKNKLVDQLKKFSESISDIYVGFYGNSAQIYIREAGLHRPISAYRLSVGTVLYLCLIAVLCHPNPPPLVCIEEPELGMHPDIIPTIARLLVEASQRTQLIVTTHSAELISALSETPEAVVVCERDDRGTHLRRLEPDRLETWLERYQLGDLWQMGEIGGNRW